LEEGSVARREGDTCYLSYFGWYMREKLTSYNALKIPLYMVMEGNARQEKGKKEEAICRPAQPINNWVWSWEPRESAIFKQTASR